MGGAAEFVLDGLSAWNGAHRAQLRQALDDTRARYYEVMRVWVLVPSTLGRLPGASPAPTSREQPGLRRLLDRAP